MKNFTGMIKKAQKMQEKMQDTLTSINIEGQSGAGIVKVFLNGKGEMRSISLDKSIINANEKEFLEDLIVAAYNDAKSKVDTTVQEKMKDITGNLKIDENFKFPFK